MPAYIAFLLKPQILLTTKLLPLQGSVIFGDDIDTDYLAFNCWINAQYSIAPNKLKLVQPTETHLPKIDNVSNQSNEPLMHGLR